MARRSPRVFLTAPASTFDARCPDGATIPIEERSPDEVLYVNGGLVAPADTVARNWGFDVTPARLITSWITDRGVLGADDLQVVLIHRAQPAGRRMSRRPGRTWLRRHDDSTSRA